MNSYKKRFVLTLLILISISNTFFLVRGGNAPISVDISKNATTIHVCVHYANDDTPLWRAHVVLYSEPSGLVLLSVSEGIIPDATTYSVSRAKIPETDTIFYTKITNTDDSSFTIYSVAIDDIQDSPINIEDLTFIIPGIGLIILVSAIIIARYSKKKN